MTRGRTMSDTSQGQGWWLASDGKWYPPDSHPKHQSSPTLGSDPEAGKGQAPPSATAETTATDSSSARLAGGAALLLGAVLAVLNFNAGYDCIDEVMCHADGGLSPTFVDKLSWSVGLASEQARGGLDGASKLQGIVALLLLVGGLGLLAWSARSTGGSRPTDPA